MNGFHASAMPSLYKVMYNYVVPYSGFLSREKTFANCLKIDFRGENFRESPQKREIRESFLPRKKPAIRYVGVQVETIYIVNESIGGSDLERIRELASFFFSINILL